MIIKFELLDLLEVDYIFLFLFRSIWCDYNSVIYVVDV